MTVRHAVRPAIDSSVHEVLDTAIVVPSAARWHATASSEEPHPAIDPLVSVAGVPLLRRTVLALQRSGIRHIIVVSDGDPEPLKAVLKDEARITATLRWVSPGAPLLDAAEGPRLVAAGPVVFSQDLVQQLRWEAETSKEVLISTAPSDASGEPEVFGRLLVLPDGLPCPAPLGHGILPALQGVIDDAARAGHLRRVPAALASPCWYYPIRRRQDLPYAERLLLQTQKDAHEGLVDRYVNRKVSAVLTRVFLKARWSPNAITGLSLLLGMIAAGLFARGTYTAGVLGAVLFQFSAIVDCCDGDVARLTFRESRLGQRLDYYGDNVVHMAIFAALGWAGYAGSGHPGPLALSASVVAGSALSLWFVRRLKAQRARRVWRSPMHATWAEFLIKRVASRDFSVLVLFLALIGHLDLFLWIAALGANAFWIVTAWLGRPTLATVRA